MPSEPKPLLTTDRFRVEEVYQDIGEGKVRPRQVVRHPGAVAIVPMVDPDHVCLIRNYRPAVERTLIEIPAGTLEPCEPPTATAHRELIEETGYQAAKLTPIHQFLLSPGILDEVMHVFLAEDLSFVGEAREPGEEIENLVVPWSDAIAMVRRGEIADAKTIVGLLLCDERRAAD